jgi:hypothetical protein
VSRTNAKVGGFFFAQPSIRFDECKGISIIKAGLIAICTILFILATFSTFALVLRGGTAAVFVATEEPRTEPTSVFFELSDATCHVRIENASDDNEERILITRDSASVSVEFNVCVKLALPGEPVGTREYEIRVDAGIDPDEVVSASLECTDPTSGTFDVPSAGRDEREGIAGYRMLADPVRVVVSVNDSRASHRKRSPRDVIRWLPTGDERGFFVAIDTCKLLLQF